MNKRRAHVKCVRTVDHHGDEFWWDLSLGQLSPDEEMLGTSVVPAEILVESLWEVGGGTDWTYLRALVELMGLSQADVARLAEIDPNEAGEQLRGRRVLSEQVVYAIRTLVLDHIGKRAWLAREMGLTDDDLEKAGELLTSEMQRMVSSFSRKGKWRKCR